MPYWRKMYPLLNRAGIPASDVFFTNIYVGLTEGATTGEFPGAISPSFRGWCDGFLDEQLRTMMPRTVVAMGGYSQRKLGVRSGDVIRYTRAGATFTMVGLVHTSWRFYDQEVLEREAALLKLASAT
jgi:uracil-DNA glycosylase